MSQAWLVFWGKVLPELLRIAKGLFEDFDGDADKAVEELKRVRKHRTRYDDARSELDAALEEAEEAGEVAVAPPEQEQGDGPTPYDGQPTPYTELPDAVSLPKE